MTPRAIKRSLFAVCAGVMLVAGLLLVVQGSLRSVMADPLATSLFASTSGAGTTCSQAAPCSLATALSTAATDDTVYVAQGTYTGAGPSVITITQSITLYGGWNGAGSGGVVRDRELYPTTLDGEGERRVVYISGTVSPTIDGFIITYGNASNGAGLPGQGGGIYGGSGPSPIISHNVIRYNTAHTSSATPGHGGGIYLGGSAGTAIITANLVISNVASTSYYGYGGGIAVGGAFGGDGPVSHVANNTIVSNTGSITGGNGYGGGVSVYNADGSTIEGNTVENNLAKRDSSDVGHGGGLFCFSTDDATIRDNVVYSNTAGLAENASGGGIRASGCDRLLVEGNTLEENLASSATAGTGFGGGFSASYCDDLVIRRNYVISNTSGMPSGRGGGVYLGHGTSFTMTNNIVAINRSSGVGGGLGFETGPSTPVTGTLVYNTFAANDGGTTAGGRAAIFDNTGYVTLVLTNNLITSHTYGIYIVTNSSANLDHTLFHNNTSGDTFSTGTLVSTNEITGQSPGLDMRAHLTEGSPAFNTAVDIPWVTLDIDGDPRPLRGGFDIGADEMGYFVYLPLVLRSY